MGASLNQDFRYAAFISYAHADEAMAARLHRALETYPVPKHLRAQDKTTKPVFRDVAELTAAHSLSEKIRDAVKSSRVLIVLCSPAAKASHWVNEEIRLFRELHGDAAILSALVEGTPATSFPQALIEGGREPLAAALGTDKAGFKLGVTQLAAGMLGVGLDDLLQRGAKRRQRIMGVGLAASLALSGVMGFTTLQAVEAREEAEVSRADAEGLVEYMIKDLKFKLEPVGRLDLLEGIGEKAVEYYDKQDIKSLPDDSLIRQAAARQVLAEVALDAGRMEDAQREIEASAGLTREVLARNPDDTDAIFAHAQSEFWVGKYYFDQNQFAEVEPYWQEYNRLSQKLHQLDPDNFDWIMEAAWSANAMGAYYDRQRDYVRAGAAYEKAAKFVKMAIAQEPDNLMPQEELANILAGQARSALYVGSFDEINALRQEQEDLFEKAMLKSPENISLIFKSNLAKFSRYIDIEKYHEKNKIENLNVAIRGFETLVKHDKDNKDWLEKQHAAYFSRLDHYYSASNEETYSHFYKELMQISPSYFDMDSNKITYMGFNNDLVQFRYGYLKVTKVSASKKLDQLNNKYYNQRAKRPVEAEIDSMLMLENDTFGNQQYANLFAKKYLNYEWIKPKTQRPAILYNKIIAFSILKDCSTARRDAYNLSERGFILPAALNSYCSED